MACHLETVFAGQYLPSLHAGPPPCPSGPHEIDNHCPFTIESIEDALKSVAHKKALGLDHLCAEMFSPITQIIAPTVIGFCIRFCASRFNFRASKYNNRASRYNNHIFY